MENNDVYQDLFEDAPVAYHELDCEGVVRRVNRAECALFGYGVEEMVGRPIWEFVAGAERETSQQAIARKLSGVQPLEPFRREFVSGDRRHLTVEIHDRLIVSEGRSIGLRSALLDISERIAPKTPPPKAGSG